VSGDELNIPRKWIEMLASAPPPPLVPIPEERDLTKVRCLITREYIPILECAWAYSGHVNYLVAAKAEALREFPKHARVVCPKCKILTLLMPPHKDQHGWEFKPGAHYHVERCPRCVPGTLKAPIIEKLVFYKAMGIPYDRDSSLTI
jgi:ribosomal protein S27AE